mgnify:CR=1 FL=1
MSQVIREYLKDFKAELPPEQEQRIRKFEERRQAQLTQYERWYDEEIEKVAVVGDIDFTINFRRQNKFPRENWLQIHLL